MELSAVPDQRAWLEVFQLQGVVVQQPLRFWICRQQYLEAAIESKAFHQVGAHSPAWPVAGLEQGYRDSCGFKGQGATEPG